jgi:hypothetical protein
MPGGDRTGPLGQGPGTGRGLGYCRGYDRPAFGNSASRFRGRYDFVRRGAGRGWRNRFYASGVPGRVSLTPEQETADLKAQAEWLKDQLDAIQKRIEELSE